MQLSGMLVGSSSTKTESEPMGRTDRLTRHCAGGKPGHFQGVPSFKRGRGLISSSSYTPGKGKHSYGWNFDCEEVVGASD